MDNSYLPPHQPRDATAIMDFMKLMSPCNSTEIETPGLILGIVGKVENCQHQMMHVTHHRKSCLSIITI